MAACLPGAAFNPPLPLPGGDKRPRRGYAGSIMGPLKRPLRRRYRFGLFYLLRILYNRLRHNADIVLRLFPVSLLNSFPYSWKRLHPITSVISRSIDLVLIPLSPGQALILG